MSHQAVTWALDYAPMLRTSAGLPDTTARAVLVARAERADEQGRDSHASIADVIWRTGFDARTIERAEKRLKTAGLLVPAGKTRWGTNRWDLDMSLCRDLAERDQIEAQLDAERAAEAARVREYRRKQKGSRTDGNSVRTDPASVRTDSQCVRTDAAPGEPSLNHPATPHEPPTGGAPPPDPRRLPPPTASGTVQPRSLSEPLTPAQGQVGESLPRTRASKPTPLALGRRAQLTQGQIEIAAAAARRAAARAAHKEAS